MLAHRESFGLPICEAQACGALIFTPRAEWAGAHWLKDDLSEAGPGRHSPNFVVYEDNVDDLVEELLAAQDAFDPSRTVDTFLEHHPQLYHGDREAVSDFLDSLESGAIHSTLHREHAGIGRLPSSASSSRSRRLNV